ncbi:hypothetical protein [Nitrosospira sp. Nsp2]|uniref:hypothetical protein n=1 Tax=Nitrosospira sp. Nsp2 TaxID=136548 RepID=UPI0011B27516|nr:hypothetical protein [Nitrosospira sp. Nsp2]
MTVTSHGIAATKMIFSHITQLQARTLRPLPDMFKSIALSTGLLLPLEVHQQMVGWEQRVYHEYAKIKDFCTVFGG